MNSDVKSQLWIIDDKRIKMFDSNLVFDTEFAGLSSGTSIVASAQNENRSQLWELI